MEAASGGLFRKETSYFVADGTERLVDLTLSPVMDETGRVLFVAPTGVDITDRKRSEEDLRIAQSQLQQYAQNLELRVAERTVDLRSTNEQLEAFVYSIAHDLRAPLRTITGFSELLLSDHADEISASGLKLLERINVSSEFLDKLLLDLLAFGRLARAEVELTRVDVRHVWESALFQTAEHIARSNARVEVIGPLPIVLAHEATLGQCLANLLSNAIKFVDSEVQPVIRFGSEEVTAPGPRGIPLPRVRLWLEDNGIGIDPQFHSRVFQLFRRLHTRDDYEGTGAGLAICQKIVQAHAGKLWVESELQHGSKFFVEFSRPRDGLES